MKTKMYQSIFLDFWENSLFYDTNEKQAKLWTRIGSRPLRSNIARKTCIHVAFFVFDQLFFSRFSKLKIFGFHVFYHVLHVFMTLVLIFRKFGMYLTYKNWFWDHFSCFFGRCIYSTVWTRNGSKIKKRVMVFKGLITLIQL